jgi:hypothetical protein
MIGNFFAMIFTPRQHWRSIAANPPATIASPLVHTAIFAIIPAIAWYFGTTKIGWQIGDGDMIRLTTDSARNIMILFYLAMIASIIVIGSMIHWMSVTYGANSSLAKGLTIATCAATPLFLSGFVGFYPQFWIDLTLGILVVSYAVYLLYVGIPIIMNISEERGFLFSSAVLGVCFVILMALMGGSVIMWDMGAAPSFTD